MADMLLRLDDDLIAQLTLKADLKGRSLEEELRDIITTAAYRAVRPPSMANSAPVTKRDSSDSK
jgi:plasmid stability protein